MKMIYEGKAKRIYEDGNETVVMEFKDSLTAFNAQKVGSFEGKGSLNLKFTTKIFDLLQKQGVENHFVEILDGSRVRVKRLKMLPVEVVVRNKVAGSLSKRLGIQEGFSLKRPLVEFYFKKDELGDPLLTEEQILVLEILTPYQMQKSKELAQKVNKGLLEILNAIGVDLIDFKIEIGMDKDQNLILADEITPDSCRLWDQKTGEKLDKDVFRRDLGDVAQAYHQIAQRLGVE